MCLPFFSHGLVVLLTLYCHDQSISLPIHMRSMRCWCRRPRACHSLSCFSSHSISPPPTYSPSPAILRVSILRLQQTAHLCLQARRLLPTSPVRSYDARAVLCAHMALMQCSSMILPRFGRRSRIHLG